MGLIAKSVTKRKVAPETGPDNVVGHSPLERSLLSAARVRAAMLSRSLTGVSSQTRRGSVSVFAFGQGSEFWYRRLSDDTWSITLGTLAGGSRPATDWTLDVNRDGDGRVTVSTPEYLMVDGSLANPRVYDDVRSRLLDAFAYDYVGDDAEVALCEQSLALSPTRGVLTARLSDGPVKVTIRGGSAVEIDDALAQIGLPQLRSGPSELTWCSVANDAFLTLSRSMDGDRTTLSGQLSMPPALDRYRSACVEAAANAWRGRAPLFLSDIDPDVELSWPEAT